MATETNQQRFDAGRAEQFAEQVLETLNRGAISLLLSIGHRTGLFDTMATMPPATSAELAEAAGLQERYVREWLHGMTVARVVEHDPERGTFALPPEHAACLTRGAGADNAAVFAQYLPLVGAVEDDVVQAFKEGGGVPYERYTRFHEVMAEDSGLSVLTSLFDHILPLVPRIPERLEEGIDVIDLGCGSGRALLAMAQRYPRSRFVGYDLSRQALEAASRAAGEAGISNLRFEVRDLRDFDRTAEPEAFDFATTFDAVHDQPAPRALLAGIRRTLRPDGVYLMQDIRGSSHVHRNMDHPLAPLVYTISTMHCMTVSLAQGGEGLGAMWGEEQARELLSEAGFRHVQVEQLPHDIQNSYYIVRP
jgi:SAM-dependent methyltransferase